MAAETRNPRDPLVERLAATCQQVITEIAPLRGRGVNARDACIAYLQTHDFLPANHRAESEEEIEARLEREAIQAEGQNKAGVNP
ncbi:MAG: hypothetical protein ACYDHY_12810 [Acidiferrobacterales bacterium]